MIKNMKIESNQKNGVRKKLKNKMKRGGGVGGGGKHTLLVIKFSHHLNLMIEFGHQC
jgi:hypothetical protein